MRFRRVVRRTWTTNELAQTQPTLLPKWNLSLAKQTKRSFLAQYWISACFKLHLYNEIPLLLECVQPAMFPSNSYVQIGMYIYLIHLCDFIYRVQCIPFHLMLNVHSNAIAIASYSSLHDVTVRSYWLYSTRLNQFVIH